MPTPWISEDPAPDHDLPSDLLFRFFLDNLTPDDVAHIRDPKPNTPEGRWLAARRQREDPYGHHHPAARPRT